MGKNKDINIYHNAVGVILSSTKKKDALHTFKNKMEYRQLCQLADGISTKIRPFRFTIYGNPLPETLEKLGKSDELFKPESVENEINWTLLSIREFSKEISLFLLLKKDFENSFLLGDYSKAEKLLETINNDLGYSLWYIESKFLLLEYQNKSEQQKEFLSEINEANKNGMLGTLAHFLSYRTERNLSAYKYDYDIGSIFKVSKNPLENDTRKYYLFRLNFYENLTLNDYSPIVLFENCNSILDRYLLLRDLLKIMSFNPEKKEFVFTCSRYIYRKTKDTNFIPLLYFYDSDCEMKAFYREDYLRILDLYYSGFYEDVINECRDYLNINTNSFDLIVIYAQSHINLRKSYTNICIEKNALLNQICSKVYDLLNSNFIRNDLLYNLYQINKNILSFDITPGLDCFLKNEKKSATNRNLKLLSTNAFDPYFSFIYKDVNDSNVFLTRGLKYFPSSISISHRSNFLNNKLSDECKISKELYTIDKAKILFNQGKYDASIQEWKSITEIYFENPPIIQTALKFWFESLVRLGNYNESISLYSEYYLKNSNSVTRIDTNNLIEILRKVRYQGIKRTIDLPIFVSLNSVDDTEKSFILEQYCRIFNKTIPSQLIDQDLDINEAKIELFFNVICSSETLKHSIYINTTIERLNERLNIINFLIEKFPENEKSYQEELNLISNELIIYEGTQKLEESKIYANDQAIVNYELNEIEGLFNRYKTIYKLSLKDKKILVISDSTYALFRYDGKEKYNETEVKYTDSALLEVFHELFDSILDKYLFSKFGIVAYLSTRIRHGVLLGEIRPEIEKQNLILSRISNSNNYKESHFWNRQLSSSDKQQKLHQILTSFSLKVDTLIENIIKDKIQIKKDGKNLNGLFDYEYEKDELYYYAIDLAEIEDAKEFCQKVIDLIWKRTDANLDIIRAYFDNEIKNLFAEELNSLDKELRTSLYINALPQIFTNIVECSTIIENKLNKISSWFRRSGSSIDNFNIKKVFDIVWKNTVKCYPKVHVNGDANFEVNPVIKSNFYIHFTDLFRILLDNMFKHGEFRENTKHFTVHCSEVNGSMLFIFTNDREEGPLDIPLRSEGGQLVVNTTKLISEHKSGISKAIKIVKYDLGNENNFVRVSADVPNKFIIEIAINTDNLVHNETNSDC